MFKLEKGIRDYTKNKKIQNNEISSKEFKEDDFIKEELKEK